MADGQLPDSLLDQQVPGFRWAIYQDSYRFGRHRTIREAISAVGGCLHIIPTPDGWAALTEDDRYEIRLERAMNPVARFFLSPVVLALWVWDHLRRLYRATRRSS